VEELVVGTVVRVYYNAVYGALGGLMGWMLFGVFGDKSSEHRFGQALLGGMLVGGCIGYLVVSVEAIRDGALVRIARLATYGVLLGAVGGAIGMVLGEEVNYAVTHLLFNNFLVAMLARGLGWTVLGVAIGMSEGFAARSLGKFSYGTLGGAIGGFVGGCLFGLVYYVAVHQGGGSSYLANALGLVILGACIGSLSALVQAVFEPASVKVMRGWQEGREYPLEKPATSIGRDEHADIALFRDMKVEKKHAFVKREGPLFIFVNNGSPPQNTLVNEAPIYRSIELHDGDRIQLGNVLLKFQARVAVNRARRRAPLPVASLAPSMPR
jgi:hypothetical protein